MFTRRFTSRIVEQFQSLHVHGDRLALNESFPAIFGDGRYSTAHKNGGRNNHFQGMQRLGQYALITGSYPYPRKRSDLLVVQFGSRPQTGPWGSNLTREWKPRSADHLENYFELHDRHWHAGGPGLFETIAAMPLEGDGQDSLIRFLDMSQPETPVVLADAEIARSGIKATACALTALANDRLLLAVYAAAPEGGGERVLHLYLSDVGALSNFELVAEFRPPDGHDFKRGFQCLDFVWNKAPNGVEQLYLFAFENTGPAEPIPVFSGDDTVYLFKVKLGAIPENPDSSGNVQALSSDLLDLVDDRILLGAQRWFNLDAGGCAHVSDDGRLIVYSVHHFMVHHKGRRSVKVVEFRSTLELGEITSIADAWVELYEDENLGGRRLTVLGGVNDLVRNRKHMFVDGDRLDKIRAVRAQIPAGTSFALFPKTNFEGIPVAAIDGTGRVQEVNRIATQPVEYRSARFGLTALSGAAVIHVG